MINNKKFVAIIVAREGSSRLPGKHSKLVMNRTILSLIIERTKSLAYCDEICLATTNKKEDNTLVEIAKTEQISCFRGDENDVLKRIYDAAVYCGADYIIEIGGDCPFVDRSVVDKGVELLVKNKSDFVCNFYPASYPDGIDLSLMTRKCLEKLNKSAKLKSQRMHPFPFIFNNLDIFSVSNLENERDLSNYRLTLDYKEDFELIKKIFENLYPLNPLFGLNDIINLLESQKNLVSLNSKYTLPSQPNTYWNTLAYIDDLYLDIKDLVEEARLADKNKNYNESLLVFDKIKSQLDELIKRAIYKRDND